MMTDERQTGAELDAEISRVVFERETQLDSWGLAEWWRVETYAEGWERVPAYSTDIAAAWQVVERLADRFPTVTIEDPLGPVVSVSMVPSWHNAAEGAESVYAAESTLPLAICRAALRALAAVERGAGEPAP